MSSNKIPSVGKIVFWMIVFYPVGFFFLFKRIKAKSLEETYSRMYNPSNVIFSQNTYSVNIGNQQGEYRAPQPAPDSESILGRRYRNIALAEIIGGVLFSMSGLGNLLTGSDLSGGLISIGISLILIWLAYRRNIKITKYQPYLNYLNSFESTSISSIARFVCRDELTVRSDLMDMIGCKMIDAKLSEDGQVILAGAGSSAGAGTGSVRAAKKTVSCPHCGAPTTIYPGRKNNCEYCGLSIEE